MKRLLAVLLFALAAVPALALTDNSSNDAAARADRTRRPLVVDEVIRMSQSGVGDDAIVAYVKKYRDRFDVNADDVIAMNDAHVSKEVVRVVVDESAARRDDRADSRDRDRAPARVYTGVYFDPWYYPGYYYDPFYYGWGPRFSIGLRIGPRFGGHFRHRRW